MLSLILAILAVVVSIQVLILTILALTLPMLNLIWPILGLILHIQCFYEVPLRYISIYMYMYVSVRPGGMREAIELINLMLYVIKFNVILINSILYLINLILD